PMQTPFPSLTHLSPSPEALARAGRAALMAVGLTSARAECVREFAGAIANGSLRLEPAGDSPAIMQQLLALPGIGPWTAEYIAMRALRWPDAFPATDLGVKKALGAVADWQVQRIADSWRPWRAYAVMHLWNSLHPGPPHDHGSPISR